MDAAFEQRLLDWGSGNGGTTEALLEEYGELVYSDRDLGLQLEDGVLGGWICLAPREEIPRTVQLEELYRNSARLEQFRENCQAGRPDQLVWLHEGDPLPFTLDVYTFDGTAILRESINPMWGSLNPAVPSRWSSRLLTRAGSSAPRTGSGISWCRPAP